MNENAIKLTSGTAPGALAVARTVLVDMGYLWKQNGRSAEAHEGGKEITRRHSQKVLVGLEAQGDVLVLRRCTNGSAGFAAGLGPLTALRVSQRYATARRAVEEGLVQAGFV